MKNKFIFKILIFVINIIILITLTGCSNSNPETVEQQAEKIEFSNNITVSRALVAKMLAVVNNDLNSINSYDREINFTDTNQDLWFDKYINTVFIEDIMQGYNETEFKPDEPITVVQAQALIDKMNPQNKLEIDIDEENKNQPISYELWVTMYMQMLEDLSGESTIYEAFGIKEKNIIIMDTYGNNSQLKEYNLITDWGPMTCYGLNMDDYIDKQIKVLEKDNDIIAILGVEDETPTIYSAYVVSSTPETITIFSGGVERTYLYTNDGTDLSGKIVDITINDGYVDELVVYDEVVTDKVERVTSTEVEFKELPNYQIDSNFKVYSTYDGEVKWKSLSNIVIGSDTADFYVKDNLIHGAVISRKPNPDTIRVAISTTGFTSLIHNDVTISATSDFNITYGDEVKTYKAYEEVPINNDFFVYTDRVYIETIDPEGKIIISSIKRNWADNQSPQYRGVIEVAQEQDGGYTVINEVGMEEYLYSVVPSEMPSNYGLEASMVQAVTARSFAYTEYMNNRYHAYGANIDDSVSSQVYNNIPENETSIEAVNNTKGECLTYNNKVIVTNFFSTSAGVTANSGEVWRDNKTKQFPTYTPPYLSSQKLYKGGNYSDLSDEEQMREFLTDPDITSYDSDKPFFRWNVEMTAQEITDSVNHSLNSRYSANPSLIKTLGDDGLYKSKNISTVGTVTDIDVKTRSEAGNITEMIIVGTEATILVQTEYNIRALVSPYQYDSTKEPIVLNLNDGSTIENYSIMPSTFYVMDKTYDDNGNLETVVFTGGGNGHGVGMSQTGVKGMVDEGFEYKEILEYYYPDTKVEEMIYY